MDRPDMITSRGTVRLERSAKRVRVQLGGRVIADTTRPMLVWEKPHHPTYYIPLDDIDSDTAQPKRRGWRPPSRGVATLFTVKVPGREAADAAARYEDSPITELRDLVRFDWEAMDAWYEEDEPVDVHPRDPHTRIDILASSRHVRVEVAGVTVAYSPRPRLLFETGLPTRDYLPRTDVRMDLLENSETVTRCPYKGQTEHFAARIDGQLRTWPGPIRCPCRKARRSRGLSRSTTRGSTRSSTAPGRTDRRHRSASGRRGRRAGGREWTSQRSTSRGSPHWRTMDERVCVLADEPACASAIRW